MWNLDNTMCAPLSSCSNLVPFLTKRSNFCKNGNFISGVCFRQLFVLVILERRLDGNNRVLILGLVRFVKHSNQTSIYDYTFIVTNNFL